MRRPVHLWIVGIVSLLWNAGGGYDYVMMQTHNADYQSLLNESQMAYFHAFPLWATVGWALGVWASIAGSILLLLRSRFARMAFALSFLGLACTTGYGLLIASPSLIDISDTFTLGFSMAIAVIIVLLWGYARAMTRRGVLR